VLQDEFLPIKILSHKEIKYRVDKTRR